MTANRSVPVDTVLPHVVYQDIDAAIEWLTRVFGFIEHYRYGEPTSGAQMFGSRACIMVRNARAKAGGATIVEEPHETEYGEYQYAALDLDRHQWLFSRHARDLSPSEWGAKIAAH